MEHCQKYGHVYGVYCGLAPVLTISDVDLIKNVLIKDFHLFVNRRQFNIQHPQYCRNLFFVESDDWKRIRSITSPAFTSGKLRKMLPLLKQSTDQLDAYLDTISKDKKAKLSVNIKDVITGFTIDVIASTSFGIDTNSNGDRSKFDPFLYHGQRMVHEIKMLTACMMFILPKWLLRTLGMLHPFVEDSFNFFVKISKEIMQRKTDKENLVKLIREAHISENDLKNLNYNKLTATADAENDNQKVEENENSEQSKFLTDDEVISQSILFFVAGFETTSSAITNTIFEMVHQPELQDKLCKEIEEKLSGYDENDLEKYYDKIINGIPYLDAILKETLRKYPPLTRLERRLSAEKYKLGNVELEKNTLVEISTIAVHYDEQNYSNPHRFDPERFMPENKHLLNPYAYLPFGAGPRNCVGMRFAYQEAKIALAKLFQKYRFHKTDKTPERLVFPRNNTGLFADHFDVAISSRN